LESIALLIRLSRSLVRNLCDFIESTGLFCPIMSDERIVLAAIVLMLLTVSFAALCLIRWRQRHFSDLQPLR
jgi:hypothetical protein